MTVRILNGDCRDVLKTLPDESVHCVVTSPPYFGLRDYGVEGQMGLEPTPEAYVAGMVEVFREVRRVLRSDGTLWLNIGDSYATNGGPGWQGKNGQRADRRFTGTRNTVPMREQARTAYAGLKPKDMVGIPWRLAFALQADGCVDQKACDQIARVRSEILDAYDGADMPDRVRNVLDRLQREYSEAKGISWWLRQDIIWHKPNPMPESITDRCTKAHEYLFLMAKSERYYFDAESISEACSPNTHERYAAAKGKEFGLSNWARGDGPHDPVSRSREAGQGRNARPRKMAESGSGTKNNDSFDKAMAVMPERRNKRSVWTVTTQGFPEAHFATFPPALIEPCILAGCPAGGAVLDPFGGAGTTGLVADRLGRDAILVELNPTYADMARKRIKGDAPLFAEVA